MHLSYLKKSYKILLPLFILAVLFLSLVSDVKALETFKVEISPIPCNRQDARASCPSQLIDEYGKLNEKCADSLETFQTDPAGYHYWVEDPEITAQGKSNERARQFIYWSLNTSAIDESVVLRQIWTISSLVALFFTVIVAAVFGIGFIISRKTNFQLNIQVWPTVIKIGIMVLWIALSASIVLMLIQLSEILMRFFIDRLGGNNLFNVYFSGNVPGNATELIGRIERNYTDFVGCRDLNIRVQEGVNAELFLLKLTNITYYIMGVMLLLRKILLWFLLFVSPFLAILMPFVFIRNTGWIWIGVFFQWLFYGPLFALFLGALSKIWENGIPFNFDFSRAGLRDITKGYVYPTGINILYGGPAQTDGRSLHALNNGSYIDTFAEYILTLIMLWAVTFFPWWLLRIFRDYCCDGIYAARNILLAMYNQMQGGPPPTSPSGPNPQPPNLKVERDLPRDTQIRTNLNLESLEKIRNLATTDISKNLNLNVSRLGDIAHIEMNQQLRKDVQKNLSLLSNPIKATTPAERQQYMNLRTELFSRAVKNDAIARTILAATSTSKVEQERIKKEMLKTITQGVSVSVAVSLKTKIGESKVTNITNSFVQSISSSSTAVNNISKNTKTSTSEVKDVLKSFAKNTSMPISQLIDAIASDTKVSKSKIKEIISQTSAYAAQSSTFQKMAARDQLSHDQVSNILDTLSKVVEKGQSIQQSISSRTGLAIDKAQSIINSAYKKIITNNTYINQIHNETGASQDKIKTVLESYSKNTGTSARDAFSQMEKLASATHDEVKSIMTSANNLFSNKSVLESVAQQENVSTEDVEKTIQAVSENTRESMKSDITATKESTVPMVTLISAQLHIPEATAAALTKSVVKSMSENETVMKNIQTQTGLNKQQVNNVLNTYAQNISQPANVIAQRISQSSGVAKDKVPHVISQMSQDMRLANNIVDEIAKKEGVKAEDVQNVLNAQIPLAADTERHIEETISIPSSVPLEDYENVKSMWTEQYESGAVPVTETIKNREDWLNQDVAVITNTLNKLMSSDEKLREQGLDDLGYTLPIFMINNLKGEEILAYMKAKLESAKSVQQTIEKAKLKAVEEDDEELVELKHTKVEEKYMHAELEDEKVSKDEFRIPEQDGYDESRLMDRQIRVNVKYATPEIVKELKVSVSKLSDLVNMEKNKEVRESIRQNKSRLMESTQISKEEILKTFPVAANNLQQLNSTQTKTPLDQTTAITTYYFTTIIGNSTILEGIAKNTKTPPEQVTAVLDAYLQNIDKPIKDILNAVAQNSNVTTDKVKEVLSFVQALSSESKVFNNTASKEKLSGEQLTNALKAIGDSTNTDQAAEHSDLEKTQISSIASSLINSLDDSVINNIARETDLDNKQVKTVLSSYAKNTGQPAGLSKDQTSHVMRSMSQQMIMSKDMVEDVAQKAGAKVGAVQDTINNQIPAVTDAEKNVEKLITLPPTVSLEDYEEVKSMWNEQYESGEVPVTENIASREEWVGQDVVTITNALNKLLSEDENVRNQGLDDVGLILPVFMANNMKGEEMLVYLKAKLESAKAIQKQMEKEKEMATSLRNEIEGTQEYVEVKSTQQEERHMEAEESRSSEANYTSPAEVTVHIDVADLTKSLDLTATHLSDIARIESDKTKKELIKQNHDHLTQLTNTLREEILKSVTVKPFILPQTTTQVSNTYIQNISNSSTVIDSIAKATNSTVYEVKKILNTYTGSISAPVKEIVTNIAKATSSTIEKVKDILRSSHVIASQSQIFHETAEKEKVSKEELTEVLKAVTTVEAVAFKLPQDKVQSITNSLVSSFIQNNEAVTNIAKESNLSSKQVQTILKSYTKNLSQPAAVRAQRISQLTGLASDKVSHVVNSMGLNMMTAKDIVEDTAKQAGVEEKEVEKIMGEQMPTVTDTEQNIEKTISLPASISLDDYEQVKTMWAEQYERGEIPISENIKDRDSWINQDVVLITNTLNKLLSADEEMKNEGLDDVGFILPVLMANNLKGEELVVYLKAKLESAKNVQKQTEKEKVLKTLIENEVEENQEYVDIQSNKEEEKHMSAEMEEEKKPSIETQESTVSRDETAPLESIPVASQEVKVTVNYKDQPAESKVTINNEVTVNPNVNMSELAKSLDISTTNLKDIVKMEVDKQIKEVVSQNREKIVTSPAVREYLLKTLPQPQSNVTQIIANKKQITSDKVSSVTASFIQALTTDSNSMNDLAVATKISTTQIQTVLNAYSQNINSPLQEVVKTVAEVSALPEEKVKEILQKTKQYTSQSKSIERAGARQAATKLPLNQIASSENSVPAEKAQEILSGTYNSLMGNREYIENVFNSTQIPREQIKQIVHSLAQNTNQSMEKAVENITKSTNSSKEQVNSVTKLANSFLLIPSKATPEAQSLIKSVDRTTAGSNPQPTQSIVDAVAQKEGIKAEDVKDIMETELPVIADPENSIEELISLPASISITDYEEIKNMWIHQYEKGEVPFSDTIHTRQEWIDTDIVMLTNTLNKLLSPDEKTREQGLDEVGFILPIFMVNNLSGEELLVYLKAKLEAAKTVKKELELVADTQAAQPIVEVEVMPAVKSQPENTMEAAIPMPQNENPLDKLKRKLVDNLKG